MDERIYTGREFALRVTNLYDRYSQSSGENSRKSLILNEKQINLLELCISQTLSNENLFLQDNTRRNKEAVLFRPINLDSLANTKVDGKKGHMSYHTACSSLSKMYGVLKHELTNYHLFNLYQRGEKAMLDVKGIGKLGVKKIKAYLTEIGLVE